MRKYFQKLVHFSIWPLIILVLAIVPYVHSDPFMDFGTKQNYSWKYHFQRLGDLSTKKLINSNVHYNSFIFGSSRTVSLYACYLNKIIPNSSFFHYGNWGESIGGIESKLELLDTLGYEIDNVIIYLDSDFTFIGDGECKEDEHYLVTKKKKFEYLISHFKSYYKHFSIDKLKILLGLKISGEGFPNWDSDLITNDSKHNCEDPRILLNYSINIDGPTLRNRIDSLAKTGFFYKRSLVQEYTENQISKSEKEILLKIQKNLDKHSTDYYIIITPLYDQQKFSLADSQILKDIFGEKVYDFSGINSITNNLYNYPDRNHFQDYISKIMIDSIFSKQTINHIYTNQGK